MKNKNSMFLLMCGLFLVGCAQGNSEGAESCEHLFKVSEEQPTCVEDGLLTYTFQKCDYTFHVIEEKLGHDYVAKANALTHFEECTRCFDRVNEENHEFHDWVCECGYEVGGKGLAYALKDDDTYEIIGIGLCADLNLVSFNL